MKTITIKTQNLTLTLQIEKLGNLRYAKLFLDNKDITNTDMASKIFGKKGKVIEITKDEEIKAVKKLMELAENPKLIQKLKN